MDYPRQLHRDRATSQYFHAVGIPFGGQLCLQGSGIRDRSAFGDFEGSLHDTWPHLHELFRCIEELMRKVSRKPDMSR
jgi:hypothetical protein